MVESCYRIPFLSQPVEQKTYHKKQHIGKMNFSELGDLGNVEKACS